MNRKTDLILVMGVSGCGKTTIGESVAALLGGTFLEGDSFHPPENKAKMGAGIPLSDDDRWPWFDLLRAAIDEALTDPDRLPVVVSCSALKRSYRDYLRRGLENRSVLVFLDGDFDLIFGRMNAREHEYMPASLLESQFATLEQPDASEGVLTLSIERPVEEIVETVVSMLS